MNRWIIDIETNLSHDTIWCIVARECADPDNVIVWARNGAYQYDEIDSFRHWYSYHKPVIVGHNVCAFDIPVLNRVLDMDIPNEFPHAIDTFVVSRLTAYKHHKGHGLDELGTKLGFPKIEFNDFSQLTEKMVEYCIMDTKVNQKVYERQKRLIDDPRWVDAMSVEHWMNGMCAQMSRDGFYFNATLAQRRLEEIETEIAGLEEVMASELAPFRREVARVQYKFKADMTPYQTVTNAYERYDECVVDGKELACFNYVPFNPGSTKDRIEKLWEFGWKPVERSDTHNEWRLKARVGEMWRKTLLTPEIFAQKKEYFEYYGWTVNEANLETLPADAPEGARSLAKWLTLDGRRKALRERLDNLGPDYRIHTNFWFIGSWTHRMAHSSPNLANISSPFNHPFEKDTGSGEWFVKQKGETYGPFSYDEALYFLGPNLSAVEEVKAKYDADMRRMFTVESGYLVGTDAESIQLRILAHYLRNDDYVHAILEGNKDDGTDIHNLNRRALGLGHLIRDDAKTFIYAWLLGAGAEKVSRILRCSLADAKRAMADFVENTAGLGELKSGLIRRDAARGYFEGLDGRKVLNDSEYLMLAGYLQNGESTVMKHANRIWRTNADAEKIIYKQVNFVHDEWQTQVYGSLDMAENLGYIQRASLVEAGELLGCYCPQAGATEIGQDWLETH